MDFSYPVSLTYIIWTVKLVGLFLISRFVANLDILGNQLNMPYLKNTAPRKVFPKVKFFAD